MDAPLAPTPATALVIAKRSPLALALAVVTLLSVSFLCVKLSPYSRGEPKR